ncbi:MAG: DUF2779 domain-containing protein [Cyanobacteria bacterium]|nr:DUF2779 domain-containing protein [Cyanobacteriota bacterium]MDW8200553.1 DUF2779 domain-containing protein [Cyanobacteriota bacterium SKYGB_h_bin112]
MSMMPYLSKSDFKLAQECPTKLYYKKLGYPSIADENPYLQLLADGSYMIEAIAKLLFPHGIDLMPELGSKDGIDHAICQTQAALTASHVTLFEATFYSHGKLARVDILDKHGDRFHLIEIKSKGYNSKDSYNLRGKKGTILAEWQPYLEDIAFQVLVLQELFPHAQVHPFLLVPDQAKTTTIDCIHSLFHLQHVLDPASGRTRTVVQFMGDPDQLRHDHFLTQVDVSAEVAELLPQVKAAAQRYVDSLQPQITRLEPPLAVNRCKVCEFRATTTDGRSGFRDCWGALADPSPHLLDLSYITDAIAQPLIQQGITSLVDIPLDQLVKKDGTIGAQNQRQRLQIQHTRSRTEWIADGFPEQLRAYPYPLHFIDFETSTLAVPYHAGMHPYEIVAFQWSCHTLYAPDAHPIHANWLNLEDYFPNLAFAQSLMQQIGTEGTVFMWSHHEQTVLRTIHQQLQALGHDDPPLQQWLKEITAGRLVDMCKLTIANYFHPLMQGKTSIKVVLEAVWSSNAELQSRYPEYLRLDNGKILSPYRALPSLTIAGTPVSITEGTGAVRAYQAMLYGAERHNIHQRQQWAQLLQQYCCLDTLAMVMIWQHWTR